MLEFEKHYVADIAPPEAWPTLTVPAWFQDAKLGIFIHWGLYSVPAWAVPRPDHHIPVEDAYTWHAYAEWYANTVRIPGSPCQQFHEATFGVGTTYEDFADMWTASEFNADALAQDFKAFGANYVIPTTKHHDGFCLYKTETTSFNAVERGPKRDVIEELACAVRAHDMRFGVYYSGAHDWHVSDYGPIRSDRELFTRRRNDESFARYSYNQLKELIDTYHPDIVWNDIDWPHAGKRDTDYGLPTLFKYFSQLVPHGVTNDRWGTPYHGYVTREYTTINEVQTMPWEATRGIGYSFGHNQNETQTSLNGTELITLFMDTVAKNGNLLINVGLTAAGTIPEYQREPLTQLGNWLQSQGKGIYYSRPAEPNVIITEFSQYWFTETTSNKYAFVTVLPNGTIDIGPLEPYLHDSNTLRIINGALFTEVNKNSDIIQLPSWCHAYPIIGIIL